MKKVILLINLLLFINLSAQNYSVVYNFKQVAKDINLTTNIKTYLQGNGTNAIYVEDFKNDLRSNADTDLINIATEDNPTFFKEIRTGKTIYNDHIRFKFFNIVDVINQFDWKIENQTKEIIGFSCQKATLVFRGRKFTMFFAPEISIPDGPLKFHGLPGLILEIYSDDETATFHYLAESIAFPKDNLTITNIFSGQETITYNTYVNLYTTKYKESLTRIVNEKGETRPMAKGFMEVLINE